MLLAPPLPPHLASGLAAGPSSLTDWLIFQEAHVMQRLALLGPQVLQPEADDALALLQGARAGVEHRDRSMRPRMLRGALGP